MECEKVGASLLFKYALINKKMDDVNNVLASSAVQQTTPGPGRKEDTSSAYQTNLTDKRFLEQLLKGVRQHDQDMVTRIHKKRGRKKFVLSSDDYQPILGSSLGSDGLFPTTEA